MKFNSYTEARQAVVAQAEAQAIRPDIFDTVVSLASAAVYLNDEDIRAAIDRFTVSLEYPPAGWVVAHNRNNAWAFWPTDYDGATEGDDSYSLEYPSRHDAIVALRKWIEADND